MAEVFQGAAWQRCTVHLMRDCMRAAGSRGLARRVARTVAPVFRAKDAATLMGEQDEEWAGSHYFSEQKMAELYDPSPSPEPAALEEQEMADEMARKAIEASLELTDRMEAA